MSRHGSSPRNERFESWTRRVSTTSLSGGPASLNSVIRRRALCPAALSRGHLEAGSSVFPGGMGNRVRALSRNYARVGGGRGGRRAIHSLQGHWKTEKRVCVVDSRIELRGGVGRGCKPAWFVSWKYGVGPMTQRIRVKSAEGEKRSLMN